MPVLPSTIAKLDNLPRVFSWKYFGASTGDFLGYFFLDVFQSRETNFPVDTGRDLNVHKVFRRRPGRLLGVLCTFNLRPVPTGIQEMYVEKICSKSPSKNQSPGGILW